jgi:hypothetical protein
MPNPHSNKPLAATTVAESKLAVSWYVGGRDSDAAMIFMDDLAKRLANRVQLTSDGHKAYLEAVEGAFGSDIDYAMLVKVYGPAPESQRRYSPAECIGAVKHRVEGNPDPKHVSTSYAAPRSRSRERVRRDLSITPGQQELRRGNHGHQVAVADKERVDERRLQGAEQRHRIEIRVVGLISRQHQFLCLARRHSGDSPPNRVDIGLLTGRAHGIQRRGRWIRGHKLDCGREKA